MTNVTLTMTDIFTEETVTRTICASNIFARGVTSDESVIVKRLNEWIDVRGNEQHDTVLELESYEIH